MIDVATRVLLCCKVSGRLRPVWLAAALALTACEGSGELQGSDPETPKSDAGAGQLGPTHANEANADASTAADRDAASGAVVLVDGSVPTPPNSPAEGDAAVAGPGAGTAGAPPSAGGAGQSAMTAPTDAGVVAMPPLVQPPEPAALCQPTAAGPYNVLERDTVTLTVRCGSGSALPAQLTVSPLPSGSIYDAATATFKWTPGIDQAAKYTLTLTAGVNDTGLVDIFVIDRADAADNVLVQDPTQYSEEYGLPVIHVTTDPGLNDNEYTPATIIYRGHTYAGTEAKLRGATSSYYPKRSLTLKFTKQDKFNEPGFAGGFKDKRKITVITTFDDNSYLRQRLGFELWNRLDRKHIQVQSYNAVLFLNGQYFGLYTIADHVDGYLMEDFGLDQEGNLFKARAHDANFRVMGHETPVKMTPHDGFTKEEGTPAEGEPGAFDELDGLMSWVETTSPAVFASEIDSKLARKEYEDWWIFVSFIMADDSSGKNSYHYHDPKLPSSLWHYVPWDLNQSFGQDWRTERSAPQSTQPEGYYVYMNGLFERILDDDNLGPALRARYGTELAGPYAVEPLLALFDGMVQEVAASAQRDETKWSATYRSYNGWNTRSDFTTFEQEAQYMRRWIVDRHAYLDSLY